MRINFGRPGHGLALGLALVAGLAACAPSGVPVGGSGAADFSGAVIPARPGQAPPSGPGECWASDVTPAVIETVSEQELASPEVRDASGQLVAPATWRSVTRLVIVEDRRQVWFRAPCPAEMTPAFIASLQRALKARGFYLAPLTGVMDPPTLAALRRYQALHGLDSAKLSLAAAQELGLAVTAVKDL